MEEYEEVHTEYVDEPVFDEDLIIAPGKLTTKEKHQLAKKNLILAEIRKILYITGIDPAPAKQWVTVFDRWDWKDTEKANVQVLALAIILYNEPDLNPTNWRQKVQEIGVNFNVIVQEEAIWYLTSTRVKEAARNNDKNYGGFNVRPELWIDQYDV